MHYGKVIGTVVSTVKSSSLTGLPLKVMIPCDENFNVEGDPIVAADPIGAREGDLVIWVAKREASLAIPEAPLANDYPLDAAITGIVDEVS